MIHEVFLVSVDVPAMGILLALKGEQNKVLLATQGVFHF
jgi:hypothetical protein